MADWVPYPKPLDRKARGSNYQKPRAGDFDEVYDAFDRETEDRPYQSTNFYRRGPSDNWEQPMTNQDWQNWNASSSTVNGPESNRCTRAPETSLSMITNQPSIEAKVSMPIMLFGRDEQLAASPEAWCGEGWDSSEPLDGRSDEPVVDDTPVGTKVPVNGTVEKGPDLFLSYLGLIATAIISFVVLLVSVPFYALFSLYESFTVAVHSQKSTASSSAVNHKGNATYLRNSLKSASYPMLKETRHPNMTSSGTPAA
ncbi:hypothetical protein QBC35DRAFT_456756 [Podospora australis]|uniref:Uncharacterized protein n=1 Tax=Podospora australis TaxID=1536484 RepID=A0AAN6WKJ7_9PEZI|nr:hypothetical protein QBC35DRAFT_456756 [Podospora australis]